MTKKRMVGIAIMAIPVAGFILSVTTPQFWTNGVSFGSLYKQGLLDWRIQVGLLMMILPIPVIAVAGFIMRMVNKQRESK